MFCLKHVINCHMNHHLEWKRTLLESTSSYKHLVILWKQISFSFWLTSTLLYRKEELTFLKVGQKVMNFLIPIWKFLWKLSATLLKSTNIPIIWIFKLCMVYLKKESMVEELIILLTWKFSEPIFGNISTYWLSTVSHRLLWVCKSQRTKNNWLHLSLNCPRSTLHLCSTCPQTSTKWFKGTTH